MVDPDSDGVPRAPPYSGSASRRRPYFAYGTVTLFGAAVRPLPLSERFSTPRVIPMRPYNPAFLRFGLLPVRSPLLRESLLISLPVLLRWFTSHSLAPPSYLLQTRGACLAACGLPHSGIPGSSDVCSFPRLFAACHALLRPSAPQASTMDLISPGHIALSPLGRTAMPIRVAFLHLPSLVLSKISL